MYFNPKYLYMLKELRLCKPFATSRKLDFKNQDSCDMKFKEIAAYSVDVNFSYSLLRIKSQGKRLMILQNINQ